MRDQLIQVVKTIPGAHDMLTSGCRVADIGCGAGYAIRLLSTYYPASTFVGLDISEYALKKAHRLTSEAKAQGPHTFENVEFVNPGTDEEGMVPYGPFDLALTFDALHDMAHPDKVLATVRRALKPGAVYFVMDWKHMGDAATNIREYSMAELMYGVSIGLCMSSACSCAGGMGLGTLGLNEEVAMKLAKMAGFSDVEVTNPEMIELNTCYTFK